jgi:small-conductance mechanosensitive channel
MNETLSALITDPRVQRLVLALLGAVTVIVAFRLFARVLVRRVEDTDTRYRTRKIISAIQYLTVLFVIAVVFKDHLGGLTVAFGVAGAGIAFALQEVIVSVAGWAAVSFGSYYRVGDRVQLGGVVGDVIDIGLLRTTLMECGQWVNGDLYNGRIVRLANSYVFKDPVVNYSADFEFLWDEVTVPISFASDLTLARKLIEETLERVVGEFSKQAKSAWVQMVHKYRIEDARVQPLVTLVFNDNWVEFTARYVVDFQRRRFTKDLIYSGILIAIQETSGKVALGWTSSGIADVPPLRVEMSSARPPTEE